MKKTTLSKATLGRMPMYLNYIRAQSTERAAIRQALTEMKDFPGLTGVMNFDEKNNVSKTCKMIKIEGGPQVLCD